MISGGAIGGVNLLATDEQRDDTADNIPANVIGEIQATIDRVGFTIFGELLRSRPGSMVPLDRGSSLFPRGDAFAPLFFAEHPAWPSKTKQISSDIVNTCVSWQTCNSIRVCA
jgi:hypothetical protein